MHAWSANGRYLALTTSSGLTVLDLGRQANGSAASSPETTQEPFERAMTFLLPQSTRRWGGHAAFSPSNDMFVWAIDGVLQVYSTADWRLLGQTSMGDLGSLAFRTPNEIVMRAGNRFCKTSVPELGPLSCTTLRARRSAVPSVQSAGSWGDPDSQIMSVSEDHRIAQLWVMSMSGDPYQVWNTERNTLITEVGEKECARVSNEVVAISDGKTIALVDPTTGKRRSITRAVAQCQFELSPDGRFIAIVVPKKGAEIIDTLSGKLVSLVAMDNVNSVRFDGGGKLLRVQGRSGAWLSPSAGKPSKGKREILWDVANKREISVAGSTQGLVSQDGRMLARTGGRGSLDIIDMVSGKARELTSRPAVQAAAIHPDGSAIAIGSGQHVYFVSLNGGKVEQLPTSEPISGLSLRGPWLAASAGKRLFLWRCAAAGGCLFQAPIDVEADIVDMAFSPNADEIAVAAGNHVIRFRTEGGSRVGAVNLEAKAIALSNDARHGLSSNAIPRDEEQGFLIFHRAELRVWDLEQGKPGAPVKIAEPLRAEVLPGGDAFLSAPPTEHCGAGTPFTNVPALLRRRPPPWTCGSDLVRYDARTGLDVRRYFDNGPIALSGDGKYVAVGSGRRMLGYDVETGVERPDLDGALAPIVDAAATHDGRRVIAASADGSVLVWDAERGSLLTKLLPSRDSAHPGVVVLGPDGSFEFVGGVRDELICLQGSRVIDFERCAKEWGTSDLLKEFGKVRTER